MLSNNNISPIISNVGTIQENDLETLKELSKKYPYSQLFSILYLKGLNTYGDLSFEDELSKHSYRIGDRALLYQLLSNENEASTPTETLVQEEVENPISETNIEVKRETESENESQPEIELSDKIDDPLDESIRHHALVSTYQLEELTEEEIHEMESKEEIENSEKEVVVEDEKIPIDINTKQSFSNWLVSDENYVEQDNADKDAIDAIVNEFESFNPTDQLFGEIEKPKTAFFSPIQKAKESLKENELPVSETLAKIYITQGNYPRAIEAYEQLSLKYPEKKIFFANQIKDLKKKLNK